MTPRRLIPYVVVFLVLVGTYVGLRWHQAQKEAQEQQAKQVFNYQEADITAITLKRGQEEIQLNREAAGWEIARPLKAKADAATVEAMVKALAGLKKDRDLGAGDLKTYGLEPGSLSVSFTAKGQQQQLVLGESVPGGRGCYARQDGKPDVFVINTGARDSLNQQLPNLRDKTLWAFDPSQVKSVRIRIDKAVTDLEKTGTTAWRWPGKADFKVRADRVEELLRDLKQARVADFPAAPPKDLKAAGLAPQAKTEVTLTTPKGAETLYLGGATGADLYARLGTQGQVVKVNKALADQIAKAASGLEDRRLWTGPVAEVTKVVWGAPDKTWTAVPEQQQWKITGPNKAETRQAAMRFQMAILDFQNLEYSSLLPATGAAGKATYLAEFLGQGDKPLFRLEVVGQQGGTGVIVRTKTGEATAAAVIPKADLTSWQQEMERLSQPPATPGK